MLGFVNSVSASDANNDSATDLSTWDKKINGYQVKSTINITPSGTMPAGCSWNGQTIPSGSYVTAFLTSSVPANGDCTSQTRTCNNGVLSGTYQYANCIIADPAPCNLPWGGTLASGTSTTAYLQSSVTYPAVCASETRTCVENPTTMTVSLSGSYQYQSCIQRINGACGPANGVFVTTQPTTGLCNTPPAATGMMALTSTTWSWTCPGANGGTNATCNSAPPSCSVITGNKTQVTANGSVTLPAAAKFACIKLIGGGSGGSGSGGDAGDNGVGGFAGATQQAVIQVPAGGTTVSFVLGTGGIGGIGTRSGSNSMNGNACGRAGTATTASIGGSVILSAAGGSTQCADAPGDGNWTPPANQSSYRTWYGVNTIGSAGWCISGSSTCYDSEGNSYPCTFQYGSNGTAGNHGGGGAGPHQCGYGPCFLGICGYDIYGDGGKGGDGYAEVTWM